MAFETEITKSIHGRELGLRAKSSAQTGSSFNFNLLVGPEGLQSDLTTGETTAASLKPFGMSILSTESSGVHTLSPPVPGVEKSIYSSGGATAHVKTANAETIESSRGSSFTTLTFNARGLVNLYGYTTARWIMGMGGDSGTSSQAPAVALATST